VVKGETSGGSVPRIVQRITDYVETQVKELGFIGDDGLFVSEPEYPRFAGTEAIVNVFVHRSYSQTNRPVFVEMYDDRIEVTSPDDYPAGLSPNQFFHNPSNPHLFN